MLVKGLWENDPPALIKKRNPSGRVDSSHWRLRRGGIGSQCGLDQLGLNSCSLSYQV